MTAPFEAFADDGPLAGDVNLTIKEVDGEWPDTVVWTDGPGPEHRHEYRLKDRSLGPQGAIPVYGYVRTLDADE